MQGQSRPSARKDVVAAEEAPAAMINGNDVQIKAVLNGLEELWDESQYAEDLGLEGFLTKLAAKPV